MRAGCVAARALSYLRGRGMSEKVRISSCACSKVRFEGRGAPILTAVCYCDDCQAGGAIIEALPGAAPVLGADGGASYLTYRDDRFRCVEGEALLKGYCLREGAPTQRFVASCCNSAMYLKYKRGHWVSAYRRGFVSGDAPAIEMRTNTRCRKADAPIPTDAPFYGRFPLRLFGRLIRARIAMALGR